MAELIKPWNDGSSLSVIYEGSGDGSAIFTSKHNVGIDREMLVAFKGAGLTLERTVKQEGLREEFVTSDGLVFRCEDDVFGVVKPSPHTRIEYIESTGTQYIDSLYVPNTNTAIELKTSNLSDDAFAASSSGTWFCGARQAYLNKAFGFYYNQSTKTMYYAFGNKMPYASFNQLYGGEKVIKANSSGLYINDTKVVSVTKETFTSPVTLTLFALNNNGSVISRTACRIHYYKIWDNDVLVRDFVPVIDANGTACMYDNVSGEYFYNAGTDNFIAGEEVGTDVPQGCVGLEYIESTGTQYIDTGFNINTSTDEVELLIQGVTDTTYKWFFGEHDDGARFGLGSGDGTNKRNVAYGGTTYKVNDTQIYGTQHTYLANASGVFLDGKKIANYTTFTSKSTIYLFHLNLGNQSSYMAGAKIWRYKHTRNGELLIDLIPVYDYNGIACMYDKVSKIFFYNLGSGEFIAGYKTQ